MKTKTKQTTKNRAQSKPGSHPSRKMFENDQNKRSMVPDGNRDQNAGENLERESEPKKKRFDEVQRDEDDY